MGTEVIDPLWLLYGGRHFLEKNVLELLWQIDQCGSITNAAKAAGISYKTAWDLIDRINNASARSLVVTKTGGSHGGGCELSGYGKTILDTYAHHKKQFEFVAKNAEGKKVDYDLFATFTRSLVMKTSARNQFAGIVEKVIHGPVSAEVLLRISDDDVITSVITNESAKELGLEKGSNASALIKASSVILMTNDNSNIKLSARNQLKGIVSSVLSGAVNDEVKINLNAGKTLVATITKQSAEEMKIEKGIEIWAIFKASQVIIAISN
jgi:molybdate transport system regulatory protein